MIFFLLVLIQCVDVDKAFRIENPLQKKNESPFDKWIFFFGWEKRTMFFLYLHTIYLNARSQTKKSFICYVLWFTLAERWSSDMFVVFFHVWNASANAFLEFGYFLFMFFFSEDFFLSKIVYQRTNDKQKKWEN